MESDPECNALWYPRGFAIEAMMDWHRGELIAPVPTTNGCTLPSMIAPRQKAMFLLALIVRAMHDEVQVRVPSTSIREGVIQGRGRAPSAGSSLIEVRMRCNHGACPMGTMSAMTSETLRGLSVGVGTWSVCSRQRRVRSVN